MAFAKLSFSLTIVMFIIGSAYAQVEYGFYNKTCPSAELIVQQEVSSVLKTTPTLAGSLLRLHFHDCFVQGCDASILLNATSKNDFVEKLAPPNLSLRGFKVIDQIKDKLENACPGVVSCADVVALAAREAVSFSGGPCYEVPLGRRDGNRSNALDILTSLPPPSSNITVLRASFLQKNLTMKDLAVLSGGHTLGVSHCSSFTDRLYNNTGKGDTDPRIDTNFVPVLMQLCKAGDRITTVPLDPGSSLTFDTSYYEVVARNRGFLSSDASLLDDPETKAYVEKQATATSEEFFSDFAESMVKMGKIGVLTYDKGEIRKKCAFRN